MSGAYGPHPGPRPRDRTGGTGDAGRHAVPQDPLVRALVVCIRQAHARQRTAERHGNGS